MSSRDAADSGAREYADGPPWVFTGRALYQLHLVKAEVAQHFIPPELKIVQAFGYTLGGLYFAQYDSSPAGVFDELVVLAGIVWNPPTSCAWAARVLVNSKEACDHGIKEVGLPSRTAEFSLRTCTNKREPERPWWNILPKSGTLNSGRTRSSTSRLAVDILETDGSLRRPLYHIELLNNAAQGKKWLGPSIQMSLPSFSGKTRQQPDLLKYSCRLTCRIRPILPAKVSSLQDCAGEESTSSQIPDLNREVVSLLTGKPILALAFEEMGMSVDAPTTVVTKVSTDKEANGLLNRLRKFRVPFIPAPSA